MKDFNDNLKPEQSWLKAEKMLDKHFYRKRMVTWLLAFFISALVITGSVLVLHSSEKNAAQQKISAEKQSVDFSSSTKNNSSAQGREQVVSNDIHATMNNVTTNEKNAFVNSKNTSVANKRSGKSNGVKNESLNSAKNSRNKNGSVATIKTQSENKPGKTKSHSAKQNQFIPKKTTSASLAFTGDYSSTENPESKNHVSSGNFSKQETMNSIHLSQVPVALADNTIRETRNENKITLPENNFNLQLSVYGSAQYVFKNVKSEMYPDYAKRRMEEEDGTVIMSFGAALSHAMKNFSVSAGIEYSSWGEHNMYVPYLDKKNTIENGGYQSYYRSDSNMIYNFGIVSYQTIQVLDSNFVSHSDTVVQSTYDPSVSSANSENRFHYLEIPVELSYRLTNNKIGVGLTAGISPAWLTSKKGYYLTRDLSGIEKISEIESFNSFVVNGRFSVDLYCRMNDRISVVLRPQVKANLNSVFKDDYNVDQKYYSTGLVFGLQYFIR